MDSMKPKRICVLGATGSIGKATMDIVRGFPDKFKIVGLSAHTRFNELSSLAQEFCVNTIALTGMSVNESSLTSQTFSGVNAATQLIDACEPDIVVSAIVGIAALKPTYHALSLGIDVLLANKESLVCAGEVIMQTQKAVGDGFGRIIPADSEHSSLAQLLYGQPSGQVASLTLTASGGPFWRKDLEELSLITPEQATAHPTWSMGPKISVDSATMVNKALEVIEAFWLFDVGTEQIRVVIHPESIIHGLVEFVDGCQFAHLSHPDMKVPLSYGLGVTGGRLPGMVRPLRLEELGSLTFAPLDKERFPAVSIALRCLDSRGTGPAIFNCANEIAVSEFLGGRLKFTDILPFIERVLQEVESAPYTCIEDILDLQQRITERAKEIIRRWYND
jgi:1-deoxy-D-xylulose-5-phosphate reductoisomerase